ncbi:anaerobic C4-dicarboxylate transporter DcuC, partial [Salmonella enterica subsp. enterica serovar Typhimurium]
VVLVALSRYILNGYSATPDLSVRGLALRIICARLAHKVSPSSVTTICYTPTALLAYINILLMSRAGDLGIMIMMLYGFAAY